MNEAFNPYAPPLSADLSAPVADVELPLASRRRRVAAAFLDSLVPALILVPFHNYFGSMRREWHGQSSMSTKLIVWVAAYLLGFVVINWTFLAKGQTIFKNILKLRVDRMEGGPCDRTRNITRRIALVQVLYLIPFINGIFMIVDCLMIFRRNRRTLHDEMAGTKVVFLGQ